MSEGLQKSESNYRKRIMLNYFFVALLNWYTNNPGTIMCLWIANLDQLWCESTASGPRVGQTLTSDNRYQKRSSFSTSLNSAKHRLVICTENSLRWLQSETSLFAVNNEAASKAAPCQRCLIVPSKLLTAFLIVLWSLCRPPKFPIIDFFNVQVQGNAPINLRVIVSSDSTDSQHILKYST